MIDYIADNFGWINIFLFLIVFSLFVAGVVFLWLPETHDVEHRKNVSIVSVARTMMHDKKVLGFGLLVAASNGILFSYFAEGSFFLIDVLGLSASRYGISFMLIASATMLGGIASKKMHAYFDSMKIMKFGINIALFSTTLFSLCILLSDWFGLAAVTIIGMTIVLHMITVFAICIITSNALAASLVNYQDCIGTASSLFGCFYMTGISLCTFGIAMLHNGTLFPMPLYFLTISIVMQIIYFLMIKEDGQHQAKQ